MMKMTQTENELNGDLFKERAFHYKQSVKQMTRAFIKTVPKEVLIDVLKSEKIIQKDWSQKGNKYILRKLKKVTQKGSELAQNA